MSDIATDLRRYGDALEDSRIARTTPGRPSSSRHRGFLVTAALVAIAVIVVVGLTVLLSGPQHRNARVDVSDGPAAGPTTIASTPWFAPTVVPSELELWNVSSNAEGSGKGESVQLFGRVDSTGAPSPGILLRMQPSSGGTKFGTALTVRGVAGVAGSPKEAVGATDRISWTEAGAAIDAVIRGLTRQQAIDALNGLTLRTTNALDGFQPATLPLLGEQLASAPPSGERTTFSYGPADLAPGAEPALQVHTSLHATYPGYLGLWIQGTRQSDGSVVVRDPGWGLNLAWPDGRQILVDSKSDDWSTLENIGRSVQTVSQADTDATQKALTRRLERLSVAAQASSGPIDARLHATTGPLAICAAIKQVNHCGSPFSTSGASPTDYVVSFTNDGTWYVVVAAATPAEIRTYAQGTTPDIAKHVTSGSWDFAIAAIPDGGDQVLVSDGPDHLQGWGLSRPKP